MRKYSHSTSRFLLQQAAWLELDGCLEVLGNRVCALLRFGMIITNLNVINVFTDEFEQIKAEGKLVAPADGLLLLKT